MSKKNSPDLWQSKLPKPNVDSNKYSRGHAIILGSDSLTGATRLAAGACSRIGAGLVTVFAEEKSDIYRISLEPDIMVRDSDFYDSKKVTAVLGGCGGISKSFSNILFNNNYNCPRIFDAGAIPDCKNWDILEGESILTPHEGEFSKVFGDITGSREDAVLEACQKTGAVIVLKGFETVIASPDGSLVVNNNASPYLAKAGTGDVLAGIITGLVAQGMQPFDACCAAVWIHGKASIEIGAGLIAGDIISTIPALLKEF